MCWSHSLALGGLLTFFPLSANCRENKVSRKLWSWLPNSHLAPAKPTSCSYSDTHLSCSNNFKLNSEKLLLTGEMHLPGSKSEIGLKFTWSWVFTGFLDHHLNLHPHVSFGLKYKTNWSGQPSLFEFSRTWSHLLKCPALATDQSSDCFMQWGMLTLLYKGLHWSMLLRWLKNGSEMDPEKKQGSTKSAPYRQAYKALHWA